jgi:hypothetical protein
MTPILKLHGRITEQGKLEVDLPDGLPPGDVEIAIQFEATTQEAGADIAPLTQQEIAELIRVEPVSGAELVRMLESGELDTSAWHGVSDGASWVEERRKSQQERRRW